MKLSQAIREGAKHTLPAKGDILKIEDGKVLACAFGAALYAKAGLVKMLGKDDLELDDMITEYFPEVKNQVKTGYNHPALHSLWSEVTCMNDSQNIRREEIANHVESLGY